MHTQVKALLRHMAEWAENQPGLMALALVGSYARGTAGPESDVDLILLLRDPKAYLKHPDWVSEFGEPVHVVEEDWGKVTSLRVLYAHGLEVEYGVSGPAWGSDPKDEGDARVIKDGCVVLYERDRHLSDKLSRFSASSESMAITGE